MSVRKRGRPRGSSPHRERDDRYLKRAAVQLVSGLARTPTEAFRGIAENEDEAVIRRLQRRWQRDGDTFIQGVQQGLLDRRWEFDARALEENAPELFAKVRALAQSEGGSEILSAQMKGRETSSLMSLGIVKLWELIRHHSPTGADAADRAFTDIYADWCRYGSEPDAAFLERFAELCLGRAADSNSALPTAIDDPEQDPK